MFTIRKHLIRLEGLAALAVSRHPACVMTVCKHSSAPKESVPEHVVTTNSKGDVILFWHPEKEIPYEHTKPMPVRSTPIEDDSPISAKFKPDTNPTYAKYGPTYKELCQMFYVTKHRFMPKPQLKRAKTNTPKDRNAL